MGLSFLCKKKCFNKIELKSRYAYIKDFDRFMFHKTKNKNKKWFCKSCLQCFNSENVLIKHKDNCLSINSKQSIKLEEGIIKFEYEGSYTEKYQDHIPCSFAYKIVCIDDSFTKPTIIYSGENAAYEFIEAILEEYKYCKKNNGIF